MLCILVVCLHVCLCALCMPDACRCQKGALDPLALELQRVVTCYGVVGSNPRSSARTSVFNLSAFSPASYFLLYLLIFKLILCICLHV